MIPSGVPQIKADCESCRFWGQCNDIRGECRRHAPAAFQTPSSVVGTFHPVTLAIHWCGDWQATNDLETIRRLQARQSADAPAVVEGQCR